MQEDREQERAGARPGGRAADGPPAPGYDLLVVGGGINGCAIARDAAGRGLNVCLAEMRDLAHATSSASTKLFHGGLRYLEFFEFRLVREALIEREVLLRAMPHISWPLRFVLPYHHEMRYDAETPTSRLLGLAMPWMRGRRPAWLIRLGLFLYDSLGGRRLLPPTRAVDLTTDPAGAPLKPVYRRAFEYSDCWVEDSRLVSLTARDAGERGATVLTRTRVVSAERGADGWVATLEDAGTGARREVRARVLVNAGGPWVEDVIRSRVRLDAPARIRLVRGSHIVTRRLFEHDRCYLFQGRDGRIIFAIPYETDFTLIGTTDRDHDGDPGEVRATEAEQDYLCAFASEYFERPVTRDDIVWTFSGVRPLYDEGAKSATAATRDYVLSLDESGAPILNVFGGKITTHRRLAEQAVDRLSHLFPQAGPRWTGTAHLPGGDFEVGEKPRLVDGLRAAYPFLSAAHAERLVKAYGTEAGAVLGDAGTAAALGRDFGATLCEREVAWLMDRELARTAEDVVWRRTKLGLRLTAQQVDALDAWMAARAPSAGRAAAE